MPYLVDGHNLIGKIPGLSLASIDDEMILISWLQRFCLDRQREIEVFFDNAPPGYAAKKNFGKVIAYFVRQGKTADQAIQQRIRQLGGAASKLHGHQLRPPGTGSRTCRRGNRG